jgi:autotransporter-associated beta strand protein
MKLRLLPRGNVLLAPLVLMLSAARLAAQTEPMHPVLSIGSNNGSSANSLLSSWTEAQYTNNFVPHWAPRNEDYGFGGAVVSGDTGWSWSSSTPNQITSTPSGTIFPTSTAYVVQTQAVQVLSGKTINAPFYYRAGSSSSKTFVFNMIDYHKVSKLRGDLDGTLDGAYIGSGSTPTSRNDNYARRIAVSLMDWARYMPDWTVTAKNSASFIDAPPSYIAPTDIQRGSDHNGLAHEWSANEIFAFDAIYNSVALTNLSTEVGIDVRGYISSNLFFNEGDFIVNHVPVSVAIGSNLSGPYAILPEVARVLNRPDYILWMDSYLDATARQKLRRDGVLEEGLGYSIGYLNANQDAAQNTQDYFLTRGATNAALLSVSNRATVFNTMFQYGQAEWSLAALPNGELPSFGDTPFNTYFSTRSSGNSAILPAYGHVSMGAGSSSSTAVQVNQNFPGDNNHMRCDTAAFVLWAFGYEYLGNIRYYNGSIGRNFGEQILEKNAVTINRVNESPYPDADVNGNANLTLYEPGNNGIAMTEIDGYRDYSDYASRYQRLMFLNSVDLNKPYLVDVFRVTGGTNHDYTFHGAILWNQNWQCSFPLATNPAPYPMLEGSETWSLATDTPYYGFWRNVSSNMAPGNFQITYSDTNRSLARDTKLWMTADPGAYNVYIGTTPVPARDNTVPTNFFNNLGLTRPSTIIRHRINSGTLGDLFVSVIEPMKGGVDNIASVTRLPMSGSSLESCALQITFTDGRVDTYIVNLRNPKIAGANTGSATVSTADAQYSLTGRVGVVMDRTSGDPRVWTVNATDFQFPGRHLTTPNTYYSGLIGGEERKQTGGTNDAFYTSSPLPTGTVLQNKFLSLTHGTLSSGTTNISEMFRIDRVIYSNSQYYVCFTNDHYLEITNGTISYEQVAPLRNFTTSNSFEIALSAYAEQISPLPDVVVPPGGSTGPINFTFGNLGTTAGASLQIITNSSNQTVVPNNLITIGGSGTNRTINVAAASGQTGSSLITISVTDSVSTNSRSFTVYVNNFALSASPPSQTVVVGGSTSYNATVAATNGFNGLVNFTVSGLPANASGNFSPPTITGAGSTTLNVIASNTVAPGTYPLTLTATSGSLSSTSSVVLVVNPIVSTPGWANWTGGSATSGNWSANANWGGVALAAGNSLAFNGNIQLNNTNDTPAGTVYSNIVFNSGAGSFVLNGNSITLIGGITNNSSAPETVALGINFSNNITLNGASNTLIIAGGFTNRLGASGSTTVTLAGSGELANTLESSSSPGGTNMLLLNNAAADWTLLDNATSTSNAAPWLFAVNNGSFTYGDDSDAPVFTSTTAHNLPQDNQIGTVSGGTGVFNMVNGTLTTFARFNTATALNSTGIVNQVGGTFNMGDQFQGANGANAGEQSIVNLSGGTMNINNGSGTFYVASRGNGVLNLSSNAVLNCGTLNVSRNLTGTGVQEQGVVNLSGGTLKVNSILKEATVAGNTGAFYFNGGTLMAKQNNAAFISTTNAPDMIVTVQAGGAIIDTGGFTVTNQVALQHDSTLGATADGGLLKTNTGTLALIATNTYTGDTLIVSGTLALAGNGSISNSANLNISAGATLDASVRSDAKLTVVSGQSLVGNGAVKGNTTIAAGGILAPGLPLPPDNGSDTNAPPPDVNPIGALTFNNNLTLSSGSTNVMDLSKNPSTNDIVNVAGLITYGGTLSLNIGDVLTATDTFKLFAAGSYSGAFMALIPAAPGPNLAWNTNTLVTDGTLRIVSIAPPPPPVIGGVSLSGGSIVMSGSNGSPGTNFYVLATTNVTLPLSNWNRLATGSFDLNGNFLFTNDPAGLPQQYYILQLP